MPVAFEDAHARIIRHLASGFLGENAPPPFQQGRACNAWPGTGRTTSNAWWMRRALNLRVSLGLQTACEKDLYSAAFD